MPRFCALLFFAITLPGQTVDLIQTIPLEGQTHHVQGIEVDGDRLWVTAVDVNKRRGLLMEYSLPAGKLVRSVEIQSGDRFHPGGLCADGDSLWVPVAEYKRSSSTVIQRRSKKTLALESEFEFKDHIGAIALTPDGLTGANWDALKFYLWDRKGDLLRTQDNPSYAAYQDMKFGGQVLIAGGLLQDRSGVIDLLDWPSLKRVRRIAVGKSDRGVAYTHEGMAIRGDKILLLPEDAPSRLFIFRMLMN
jgi:hypothetical protein